MDPGNQKKGREKNSHEKAINNGKQSKFINWSNNSFDYIYETATTSTSTISTKQSIISINNHLQQNRSLTKPIEPMDMSINLKRRRDNGDSPTKEGEKKHPQKTSTKNIHHTST